MHYLSRIVATILMSTLITAMNIQSEKAVEKKTTSHRYLRVSIAHWDINVYTPEAEQMFHQIETDGVAVFKAQPGFIRYRLMRADSTTTIAVAEWESEQLGLAGAEKYRAWMRNVGIMNHIKLETYTGDIVAAS
jgi:Antibiotic biosynthesis monooxygenase